MQHWLKSNGRTHIASTDKWYLDFATTLLPIIQASSLFKDGSQTADAAIRLSIYFQDVIAQSGGWKLFAEAHHKRYGNCLPFYHLTSEYIPDEINAEDIAFILWTLKSARSSGKKPFTLFNPYDEALIALSRNIYGQMGQYFEEAPISEAASSHWVIEPDVLEIPPSPLPEVTPTTKLSNTAARCLEYSQGKPLSYFTDYKELSTFFVDVLKWENKPSALLPDLKSQKEFVVYANAKGMLIAPGVAAYFCERHNPMYNAGRAATEGYHLFCQPGYCPFDLLKYGMAKGLLPDATFPFAGGKSLLHQHWDFIARYYLCEYYEGE